MGTFAPGGYPRSTLLPLVCSDRSRRAAAGPCSTPRRCRTLPRPGPPSLPVPCGEEKTTGPSTPPIHSLLCPLPISPSSSSQTEPPSPTHRRRVELRRPHRSGPLAPPCRAPPPCPRNLTGEHGIDAAVRDLAAATRAPPRSITSPSSYLRLPRPFHRA